MIQGRNDLVGDVLVDVVHGVLLVKDARNASPAGEGSPLGGVLNVYVGRMQG
ncbi:hypothetical protein D3C84_1027670 [compost metagenome]